MTALRSWNELGIIREKSTTPKRINNNNINNNDNDINNT